MREFTPAEQEILARLHAASSGFPVRLEQFLAEVFFSEQHGRALILQPAGRFGCFYLLPSVHDEAPARDEEVRRLIELMMLLVHLREHGFLVISGGPGASDRQMRFVGGLFRNPKPSTAHVVLNERGDYTFLPETICDRADAVIYKGVRLEGDLYDLVARNVSGLLYVSPAVKSLLPPPVEQIPSPPPPPRRAAVRWAAYTAALGAVAWLAYTIAVSGLPLMAGIEDDVAGPPRAIPVATSGLPVRAAVPAAVPASTSSPAGGESPAGAEEVSADHHGIDVSRWNAGAIEAALDTSRIDFVFVRATYGQSTDIDFHHNWNLLRQRAVIRGAYHFYLVHEDPIAQVEHYLSVVGDREPLEMPPAVDFEELSFPPRATPPDVNTVQEALLSALAHIEARTGRVPILYTNVSVGNQYLNDPRFARYPLWIADWTTRGEPTLPDAWKDAGYRIWQRSSTYRLPDGDVGPVDYDVFTGRRSDLYR